MGVGDALLEEHELKGLGEPCATGMGSGAYEVPTTQGLQVTCRTMHGGACGTMKNCTCSGSSRPVVEKNIKR